MKTAIVKCIAVGILAAGMLSAAIPVTWNVDMRVKTAEKAFTPGEDNVTLRGSFMDEMGLSGDWFPDEGPYVLADADQDTVYSITLEMDDSYAGSTFEYKYQINDATWEGDPNHSFTVVSPSTDMPVEYFDRDSVVTVANVNFLNFRFDLTKYYGSGLGYFDPSTDVIKIEGFWGDGIMAELSPDSMRYCRENIWQPGIFETQIIVTGVEGSKPEFKAHANPEEHFENWGWEIYDNHVITLGPDSAEINIDLVPDILPKLVPLTQDVTVLFAVDMSNAKNKFNDAAIDPATLTHVGLKGQHAALGAWAGTWELSDTLSTDSTTATLLMLNDDGVDGDVTAGDNIWSLNVTFATGENGGPSLYKYSAYYDGADTLSSFDNEMKNQDDNHFVFIASDGVTVLNDIFNVPSIDGVPAVTSIENPRQVIPSAVRLLPNYPNPFNPVTSISFDLAVNDMVKLAVYDILGREVQVLVNREMAAGSHSYTFNGARYASGVYFLRLVTPNGSAVQKMMLLK